MQQRPSWEQYFMDIARLVSTRSTCLRRQVGAVLVRSRQVISTGYNGAPSGVSHCSERGCLRQQLGIPSGERHEVCRGTHGEQNAIAQAARFGTATDGSTLYCTHLPCLQCVKVLINAGVREVIYCGHYPDPLAQELLAEAGVTVMAWKEAEA